MLVQPGYVNAKFEALRIQFFPDAAPEVIESLRFMFLGGMLAGANPCLSDCDRAVINQQVIIEKPATPPKDGIRKPNLNPSLN